MAYINQWEKRCWVLCKSIHRERIGEATCRWFSLSEFMEIMGCKRLTRVSKPRKDQWDSLTKYCVLLFLLNILSPECCMNLSSISTRFIFNIFPFFFNLNWVKEINIITVPKNVFLFLNVPIRASYCKLVAP